MYLHLSATRSAKSAKLFGVPQIRDLLYATDLLQFGKCHDPNLHAYADDTRI